MTLLVVALRYSRISPVIRVVPMYRLIPSERASKKASWPYMLDSNRTSWATTTRKCAKDECGAGCPPMIGLVVTVKFCANARLMVRLQPRGNVLTQSSIVVMFFNSSNAWGLVRNLPVHCAEPMALITEKDLIDGVRIKGSLSLWIILPRHHLPKRIVLSFFNRKFISNQFFFVVQHGLSRLLGHLYRQ